MHAWLTITSGPRAGVHFPLESEGETRIGRGADCQVTLSDPLCSRIHAVIAREGGAWFIRDHQSRNGTFVREQKIDSARLAEGVPFRVGGTEFSFHESADSTSQPPHAAVTQTIVFNKPVVEDDAGLAAALHDDTASQDLLLLHQLSVRLLACHDPEYVIRSGLDLLHTRVDAAYVGFLLLDDEGKLKPKAILPDEAAERATLSRSLTELVCKQQHAVWVAEQAAADVTESLAHFADAICVPLLHEGQVVGAIHLYREQSRFQEDDLHFAVSLAHLLGVALVRAREQARLQVAHERLVAQSAAFDELIGESKPMKSLKAKVARVARASGCVLIRGESGSGKELVARALHKTGPRADRPMLSVNCAAIPAELMESQLFGHKKGAFTSADSDHIGWFQQADAGTLFLDELGEMTLEGQAKLLRILEGHPFLPVGATKEVRVDVRVIAATNRDLREYVQQGKFREDLYYRLTVFELVLPPLRERGSDIELLLDYFLKHFRQQHGRPDLQISAEARERLLTYDWPGNVRQLRNVIDSAVVMAEGDEIEPHDLGLREAVNPGQLDTLRIDEWERRLIREALKRTEGKVPRAAKLLGVSRATLYRKIDDYGIER